MRLSTARYVTVLLFAVASTRGLNLNTVRTPQPELIERDDQGKESGSSKYGHGHQSHHQPYPPFHRPPHHYIDARDEVGTNKTQVADNDDGQDNGGNDGSKDGGYDGGRDNGNYNGDDGRREGYGGEYGGNGRYGGSYRDSYGGYGGYGGHGGYGYGGYGG
ncbi:hypothetical protein L218DRAFT_1003781 [Marasmius fiardii PR-910]|nr:hypothetical protein L218DRAFT_1003781 [Marasmius fiardii PR-910]